MLIHADGFDHYGLNIGVANSQSLLLADNYIAAGGNPSIINSYTSGLTFTPPYGLGMLQFQAYQGGLQRICNSLNTQSTQFRMNWAAGLPIQEGWGLSFMNGAGTEFIKVFFRTNGTMTVSTSPTFSNSGNWVGTTNQVMRSKIWQHWQFVFVPNTNLVAPFNAQVYIYLEGILQLAAININTNQNMGFHFIGQQAIVGSNPGVLIKDWIICDTANGMVIPTPPLQTDMRLESANGVNNAWTPFTAASNWQAVAKNSPDITSYTYATAVGQLQDFVVPVSTAPLSNVFSVLAKVYAQKSGSGAGTARVGLTSGGTTGESADIPLGQGWGFYQQFFDKDPNTNANWTSAAYNALTARLNRTA